jgi:hypothetical protein
MVADTPGEANRWPGEPLKAPCIRAVAGNDKWQPKPAEGAYYDLNTLMSD